ncbi:MAG: putative metal-binding motif-containing protein [Deltaproteobacteria bacterium]|nr:putative metal-binding motif-containing protein [Deltaproteobacteria bacterium]
MTSPTTSSCVRQAASSWCPAGWTCDQDAGCVRRDRTCTSTGECDDGVECTEDRCVPGLGVCGNDPIDADGDGVGDQGCAGTGRLGDCDDADPEVNPNHPEVCRNLKDDDCDGVTDYADEDCAGDLDNDLCENAVPLVLGVPTLVAVSGDLTGYGHESVSSCGGEGPDAFFRVTIDAERRLVLDTAHAGLDTVVSVLYDCDGDEVLCNDDRNDVPTAGSRVEHRRLPPGSYVIVVSGKTGTDAGPYALHYSVLDLPPAANCSDPIDATDGGTFVGWLTDTGIDAGSCALIRSGVGIQERFVAHVGAPADLWVSSAGTGFPTALYLRAGSCTSLDERECVTGDAWTGAVLHPADGWTGDAHITLDYLAPGLDADPGQPYRIEINP